mgnify:CR=1 FL=1
MTTTIRSSDPDVKPDPKSAESVADISPVYHRQVVDISQFNLMDLKVLEGTPPTHTERSRFGSPVPSPPYIQIKTRTHTLKPPLMSTLLCLLCDYLLLICDIVCFFKEFVNRIAKNLVYFAAL